MPNTQATMTTEDFLSANAKPFELRTTEKRGPENGPRTFYVTNENKATALEFIEKAQHDELDVYYIGNSIAEIPSYESGQQRPTRRTDIKARNRLMIDIDGDIVTDNRALLDQIQQHLAEISIEPEYTLFTGRGFQIVLALGGLSTQKRVDFELKSFLNYFAQQFNTETVTVDLSASSLPRLLRVPGTLRFKGGDGLQGVVESCTDKPTVLTLDKIKEYQTKPPLRTSVENKVDDDYFNDMLRQMNSVSITMSISELRKLVEIKGHSTSNHEHGFLIDECPRNERKKTKSNILATVADSQLTLTCQHDKCKHDTAGLLKDLDIEQHDVSSLYSANEATGSIMQNWIKLVRPVNRNRDQLTTKGGLVITVGPNGTFIQEPEKSKYHAAYTYVKKNCPHWLDIIEAPLRSASRELSTVQRLSDRIQKNTPGLILYNGVLMIFENGGYRVCEGKDAKSLVSKLLTEVTAQDVRYLNDNWGCLVREQSVVNGMVESVLTMLRGAIRRTNKWDLPLSVNYSNGIWLSQSNEFIKHDAKHFVRPSLDIEYDNKAEAPRFQKFLAQTYAEPEQRQLALQLLGCVMAGDVSHEKLFGLFGLARSGKGVLTSIAIALAGGCASPSADDLSDKHGLFHAIDKSLIVIPEAGDLDKRGTAKLKAITGGDSIQVHIKYGANFDGKLNTNIIIQSNQLPSLPDPSGAIMTRLMLLKHANGLAPDQIDKRLKKTLVGELPGIARIAREAYVSFQAKGGFTDNPHVSDMITAVREDSSPITTFLAEACDVGDGYQVTRSQLHVAYNSFLTDLGHQPTNARKFASELKSACLAITDGGRVRVDGKQQRVWTNIKLKG